MKSDTSMHEDLRREEEIKGSSNRGFGLVFVAFFVIVGAIKAWVGNPWAPAWFVAAAALLAVALLAAHWLAPLNRGWTKLGLLMFRIINPVIMFLVFITCIVPMGVVMRQFGWDPMRRKHEPKAASYWIAKEPAGSMKNQF